jgi:hypothetical protein
LKLKLLRGTTARPPAGKTKVFSGKFRAKMQGMNKIFPARSPTGKTEVFSGKFTAKVEGMNKIIYSREIRYFFFHGFN